MYIVVLVFLSCSLLFSAESCEIGEWDMVEQEVVQYSDSEGNYEGHMKCSPIDNNVLLTESIFGKAIAVVIAHSKHKTQQIYMNASQPPLYETVAQIPSDHWQCAKLGAWWVTLSSKAHVKKELVLIMPVLSKNRHWLAKRDWRANRWAKMLGGIIGLAEDPVIISYTAPSADGIPEPDIGIDSVKVMSGSIGTSIQCHQNVGSSSKVVCEYTSAFLE